MFYLIESTCQSMFLSLAPFWAFVDLMLLVKRSFNENLMLATNQYKHLNLKKLMLVKQKFEFISVVQAKTVIQVKVRQTELVMHTKVAKLVAYIEIDTPFEQLVQVEIAEQVKPAEYKK